MDINNNTVLSLCIPTNGATEWVKQVLDSIYRDGADIEKYEVIITDNGDSEEFYSFVMEYQKKHKNLVYSRNDSKMFQNQIESFKMAKGDLIKFVNHRMVFQDGAVNYLIEFGEKYRKETPGLFFMNGTVDYGSDFVETFSFDEFVRKMGHRSSWSAGTAMWKTDFKKMDLTKPFNYYFPHIDMVFSEKNKSKYIIDNTVLYEEIPSDASKKGKYDIFDAFAVEFPAVILDLYREKEITADTMSEIMRDIGLFVAWIYEEYVILKHPCSYDLSGFERSAKVFFNSSKLKRIAYLSTLKRGIRKVYMREKGK